jgi:hypothetical protein
MRALPPAYQLSRADLLASAPKCIGLPVTYEHVGIHDAVRRLDTAKQGTSSYDVSLALETSPNAAHRVLGHVADAFEAHDGGFWAILSVDLATMPGLTHLISRGMLQSVSLTHIVEGTGVTPLEIALVGKPARPHCAVRYATDSALKMQVYKARVVSGAERTMPLSTETPKAAVANSMEVDNAVVPASVQSCEDALAAMDPAHRQLVAAKLSYLVQCMDEQKAKLEKAKRELASKAYQAETDNALLTSQIEQLWTAMNEESKRNLAVPSAADLSKALSSTDAAEFQRAALKTIMCCNQSMMMRQMGVNTPAAKRTRVEEPVVAPSAGGAAAAPPLVQPPAVESTLSDAEALRRALTETFEM